MGWHEGPMANLLNDLFQASVPEPTEAQAAAYSQVMNGATLEEREAGRDALIESMGGLPPEDEDEYDDWQEAQAWADAPVAGSAIGATEFETPHAYEGPQVGERLDGLGVEPVELEPESEVE